MHICFFNRSYWPDHAATGQLLTELAEDLVNRHGCRVTVVAGRALRGGDQNERRYSAVSREIRNGVSILRANGTRLWPGRFAGRATNYLTYFGSACLAGTRLDRPDIVVTLTDPPILGLAALWAARRANARFVFLCEDVFPEVATLLADFQSAAINSALDRTNRYLLRHSDAIVVLGDRMQRRLVEEKGADRGRMHVIHNWADCEAIVPGPRDNAFAREHGLADRFVLMHSGNVGMSQELEALVEAASRLTSKEKLVVAIVGDGGKRPELEADVRRRGISNVRFFPYQPKERLADSFATADAFLVSLKAGIEGYIVPSKLYGILAAGRGYIAAVDPSCEAATIAVNHQCGVLAAPGNADALAAAIASLYDNPPLVRTLGANARRAALQFDRRVAIQRYHDLFARLLGIARAA